jgi:hypothetical protein
MPMMSDKLLDELRHLPPAEKLRIVQFLINDLAAKADENTLLTHTQYEIWSPYDSAGAAETLSQMLDEDQKSDA